MTGLILKDLYSMRRYFVKQVGLMALVYLLISVAVIKSVAFFAPMMVMSVMMMLISSFSFDETAKWDAYALTLPLSPRSIVGARYLLMSGMLLVFSVAIAALCCAVDAFTFRDGAVDVIGGTAGVAACYLLVLLIVMPLFYKLGVEKARVAMTLCFIAPFMLIVWLAEYLKNSGFDVTVFFSGVSVPMLVAGGVLLAAALVAGSYLLSVKFYAEKER